MVVGKPTRTATPHHMVFEPTSDREFAITGGNERGQMRGIRGQLILVVRNNFPFIKAIW